MKAFQLFLLAILLLNSKNVAAQQDSTKFTTAYPVGLGIAIGKGNHEGLYVEANAQIRHLKSYLSFRISSFFIFSPLGGTPVPNVSESSLLFGRSYLFNQSENLQLGIGLGMITRISRGALIPCETCGFFSSKYETIRTRSIGLPVEVKYNFYAIKRNGAFFISLNGILSSKQSLFSAGIGLITGKLR